MTQEPLSGDLRAFAEDPGAFVAIGPDEERILTDRYSVTFTPGEHFWPASVQRLRLGVGDVAGGVAEIRVEVANQGFAFPGEDALDERRRACASFQSERVGRHSVRLLALDGGRPVAAGRAWLSPSGLYLGGGATMPSERRRGAMGALVARAWEEAVDRGTPCAGDVGWAMAAAVLQRVGFRVVGRVWHLVDRIDG